MAKKPRDMTGTAFCLDCGERAVHERGPGTPLVIRHKPDCPEHPRNRPEAGDATIDWPDLFKRYVIAVAKNEGTAFLADLDVTPAEDAALSELLGPEWRWLWWSWVEGGWR